MRTFESIWQLNDAVYLEFGSSGCLKRLHLKRQKRKMISVDAHHSWIELARNVDGLIFRIKVRDALCLKATYSLQSSCARRRILKADIFTEG